MDPIYSGRQHKFHLPINSSILWVPLGGMRVSEMRLLGAQSECRYESNELGLRGFQRLYLTGRLSSRYANLREGCHIWQQNPPIT